MQRSEHISKRALCVAQCNSRFLHLLGTGRQSDPVHPAPQHAQRQGKQALLDLRQSGSLYRGRAALLNSGANLQLALFVSIAVPGVIGHGSHRAGLFPD